MFIHSITFFAFQNYVPNKEFGRHNTAAFKNELDYQIRKSLKKILGLPWTAPNTYLYTVMKDGGVGLVILTDE